MPSYTSENYYYGPQNRGSVWSIREGPILVPVIMAKEPYACRIVESTKALIQRGVRERVLKLYSDPDSVGPCIYEVRLHPEFDALVTPGVLGVRHLGNRFPPRLEDFSDAQLLELSRLFHFSPSELRELKGFEKELVHLLRDYRRAGAVTVHA